LPKGGTSSGSHSFVLVDNAQSTHHSTARDRGSRLQRELLVLEVDRGANALLLVVPLADVLVQEAAPYLAVPESSPYWSEASYKGHRKLVRAAGIYVCCMRHVRYLLSKLQNVPHAPLDAPSVTSIRASLCALLQALLLRLRCAQQLATGPLVLQEEEAAQAVVAHSKGTEIAADVAQLQGKVEVAGQLRRDAHLTLAVLKCGAQ